ncbi:MAG: hypothetical protein AAF602_33745 [Myxococcota bacterium]
MPTIPFFVMLLACPEVAEVPNDDAPAPDEGDPPADDPPSGLPTEIPAGTHDCDVDADGCLGIEGLNTCAFVAQLELLTERANAIFVAQLAEVTGLSAISVKLYSELGLYNEAIGPACNATVSGSTLTLSTTEGPAFLLSQQQIDTPASAFDIAMSCLVDNGAGTVTFSGDVDGVTVDPVVGEEAERSTQTHAIVTLRNAKLCGLDVSEE